MKNHEEKVARTIAMATIPHTAGYTRLYCPFHPAADKLGWVYEHRIVAERAAGRFLNRHEIVHHKNEDKRDNRIENLEVVSKSEHQQHHWQCVLTDLEVVELMRIGYTSARLRALRVHNHRQVRLGRKHGINRRAVRHCYGRSCSHHRDLVQIEGRGA